MCCETCQGDNSDNCVDCGQCRVTPGLNMGGKSSKTETLSRSDLEFLVKNTKYNEDTIQEWYKGFRSELSVMSLK